MKFPRFGDCAFTGVKNSRMVARLVLFATIFFTIGGPGVREANAQAYPSKPVRILVAVGPGSGDDFVARVVASKLGELFGQQFLVENRPGAGGFIGQSFVAKSPPDGYTLLLGGGSMAGARFVNAAVTYDVLRDFTPISLVETSPFVLVVHPSVPARNLKEYIALARSRPGKMTFATIGAGQIPYWGVFLFNNMARIDASEVQYKAPAEALVDIMSGRVDYIVTPVVSAVTNRARLRALAVTTTTRSPMLPEVPTMHEAALPGYDMPAWRSILGPAGIRREVVDSLNAAITRALAIPDVRERFFQAGSEPLPGSPEDVRKKYADWIVIFGKIAKDAGLKPLYGRCRSARVGTTTLNPVCRGAPFTESLRALRATSDR